LSSTAASNPSTPKGTLSKVIRKPSTNKRKPFFLGERKKKALLKSF
jgi:hypothetical protein